MDEFKIERRKIHCDVISDDIFVELTYQKLDLSGDVSAVYSPTGFKCRHMDRCDYSDECQFRQNN